MTLPATDSWDVRGTNGPKYRVGPRCSNPNCGKLAEHAHHLVRRSALAGDYAWIVLNERVLGNLTGLCPQCHDDVTGRIGGHKAAIRISDDGEFLWCGVTERNGQIDYLPQGKLEPQPPTPETLAQRAPGHEHTESDTCPFCGQTRRRREAGPPPGERRRRKTWTVLVPDDEQERGAAVLDTLVDDLAPLLGVEPNRTGRYYVLVPTLAYAQLDRKRFLETIKGVGG